MRRLRVFGHPLHPALVHMPLGLLLAAPLVQLVGRFAGAPAWTTAARVLVELGLVAAIPAAFAGILDLVAARVKGTAATVAVLHVSSMVSALLAFALARWVWDRPGTALVLGFTGVALLLAGGASGGHLVYVHGVATRAEDL